MSDIEFVKDWLKKHDKEIESVREKANINDKHLQSVDSIKKDIDDIKSKINPIHDSFERKKKIYSWLLVNWWRVLALIIPILITANYIHDKILNLPSPSQEEEISRLKAELMKKSGQKN